MRVVQLVAVHRLDVAVLFWDAKAEGIVADSERLLCVINSFFH